MILCDHYLSSSARKSVASWICGQLWVVIDVPQFASYIASKKALFLCIVSGEHTVAIDYPELYSLCERLQLPTSTTSDVQRSLSMLNSSGVVEVNLLLSSL